MPTTETDGATLLHASCVALEHRALLILGASGSGKSTLALELINLGATLVADDRTMIRENGPRLTATSPETIAGQIEARNVGILRLPYCSDVEICMAIDLDHTEPDRLPPPRTLALLGQTVSLLYRPPGGHAAQALFHCLLQRREIP